MLSANQNLYNVAIGLSPFGPKLKDLTSESSLFGYLIKQLELAEKYTGEFILKRSGELVRGKDIELLTISGEAGRFGGGVHFQAGGLDYLVSETGQPYEGGKLFFQDEKRTWEREENGSSNQELRKPKPSNLKIVAEWLEFGQKLL